MWFSIGVPNFIKIGLSAAELWRHSDFQDGGRQPCWIWFRAIVAHPRSASGGLCFILKFRLDRIYSFGDRAIFIFWHFGLKLPIHALLGVLGAYFPQMTSSIAVTPKRHFLARKHVLWAIKRENPTVRPGRRIEKKRKGQNRTGQSKKSQRRYISPIWGEAPTEPIFTKICTVVAVPDVIMCANCWAEIFRSYDFTGGQIFRFPIDSFMGLTTVQR